MTNHSSLFSQMDETEDNGSGQRGADWSPEVPKPVTKESSYYLENYEATVTVHKSPPQQRRQFFDYIEIDDETTHDFEPVYSARSRFSKRKNLKVTFSDHIEVDVIDGFDEYLYEDDSEQAAVGFDADEPKVDERVDIRTDFKSSKLINLDIDVRSTKEVLSPRLSHGKPQRSAAGCSSAKSNVPAERSTVSASQPLLPKRKQSQRASLSDLERRTKESIAKLNSGRHQRPSTVNKTQGQILPDLLRPIPQANYSQFISNAKQMVEVTRRYERPWAVGRGAPSWTRGGQDNVRRSASLPKNFKLPDNLPAQHVSRSAIGLGGRQKVRNT